MNWGMMMAESNKDPDMDWLDDMFATARRKPPEMPVALTQRMLADALDVQGAAGAILPVRPARPGLLDQLSDLLGGWYGLGGLAAACAAGVGLGFAPPSGLPDPAGLLIDGQTQTSVDLLGIQSLALAMAEDG